MVGLKDFHQRSDDAGGCVEFPGQLAFLLRESGEAVFIRAAENVLLASVLDHLDIGKQVNDIAQAPLVQFGTSKIFWQNVF